jgi:elongation factor P
MLDFSDIKIGKVVNYNGQPCVIVSCDFLKMNRGKPTKRCKMKNLVNGTSLEYNFKSGEGVEEADLAKKKASFMYQNGSEYSFMLNDTYETVEINEELLSGKEIYLIDGLEVIIVYYNDKPISVEFPIKVSLKIVNTGAAAKGNTVSDITKEATAENGTILKVPAFINEGEHVIYNTVENAYVERDTSKK